MPPPNSRNFLPLLVVLILGLAALGVTAFLMAGREETQSSLIGGPFRLAASTGGELTETDLKGHPFLVFFGYTHCPDICPTTLFQMSQALKAMGPDKPIKALFITVDPERDTPVVLKNYLSSFDPRIIGLSGSRAQIDAAEKAYRVYARKAPSGSGSDYAMDHTAIVYLMDKDGRFVTAFNLDRPAQVAAKDLDQYL